MLCKTEDEGVQHSQVEGSGCKKEIIASQPNSEHSADEELTDGLTGHCAHIDDEYTREGNQTLIQNELGEARIEDKNHT
jgi:hypothetical protein